MRETGFCVGKFGNGKGAGATSHFFRRDVLLLEFYNWGNGRKLVMLRRGDDEVMGMKVNRISFHRISVTFSGCAEPSEVFEIYIDDQKLSDFISWAGPVLRDDLYLNLMRSPFFRAEAFLVAVCNECGYLGCNDTNVYSDETKNFVIWHDFVDIDDRIVKPGLMFAFDRKQYYDAVDTILNGCEDRVLYYTGDLLISWRDKRRLKAFADCLSDSCVLKWDLASMQYTGREKVLEILRQNLVGKCDCRKGIYDYIYEIRSSSTLERKGYHKRFLTIYHDEDYAYVVHVAIRLNTKGKIDEILLSKDLF